METKFTETYQKASEDCHDTECEKVADMLDLVIDGEATPEDHQYFTSHIEACVSCFQSHQKQKLLKALVSGNVKRAIVPQSLALSIKAKIHQTV